MHEPLAENTAGMSASVKNRCTFCHSNPASGVSPQVFLGAILHPSGTATPLGDANADPSAACVSCHMPPGMTHLLRISTDPSYTTFGDMSYGYPVSGPKATSIGSGAWAGNAPGLVNLPHTSPDGVYANAVWADLDHACGQCHGGGVSSTDLVTTGSITAGSTNGTSINPLTVADVTGFAAGKTVTIAGAGWAGAPFKTIVAKVVPDAFPAVSGTVYLTYPAVTSVTGAAVTVAGNPPKPTASWFSRAQLAAYAKGMHPFNAAVLFTAAYGANGLTINVDASASSCDGSVANCSAFDWDWGDSSAHGSGVAATHVYSPTGSSQDYTITLTVTQRGYVVGSATRKVTAYNTDNPPVASGACAMDYTTWTIGCTNTSTDDKGIQSASINWGDGTVVSNVTGLGTGPLAGLLPRPSERRAPPHLSDRNLLPGRARFARAKFLYKHEIHLYTPSNQRHSLGTPKSKGERLCSAQGEKCFVRESHAARRLGWFWHCSRARSWRSQLLCTR